MGHPVLQDKSGKPVSCVKVDYKTKKQMFFNQSIQFFINARGLLLTERKGIHYAEVYMYLPVKISKMLTLFVAPRVLITIVFIELQ